MTLTAEQIQKNWDKHFKIVDTFLTGERKEQLKNLYTSLQEEMILAPASGKPFYHNAFPGGYIDHVNRVVHCALETKALWEEMGSQIDFTDEELVFVALNHDLGKIGFQGQPNYLPQSDQWRKEKLQEVYTNNKELSFMLIQDRSLFILQQYGIKVNEKEFLAIKLHDGLYDDVNKPYYMSFNPDSKLRTNLVYILHQADFLASKVEYDRWKNEEPSTVAKSYISKK
ncbi:MAG TPA: hypothetical protein PKC87_00620 [Candidatus Absconditabacterales bacterium]|nr:hypothetical protein [Candidatus Absconditabacterales bacterium]